MPQNPSNDDNARFLRLAIAVGCILAGVGVGVYALLRRSGAVGSWLADNPALGGGAFALLWAGLIVWVIRLGNRHRRTVLRLGAAGPWAIFSSTMPAIGGLLLLATLDHTGPWLRDHGGLGVALYAGAFAILAGAALLPTYSQAVLGGWAFGLWTGLPAALAGFLGGSLIGYALGAKASGDRVMGILREHPRWVAVRDALAGGGFWKTAAVVCLLRVPPNSPFAITNLVMASVRVPLIPYALGTLVGMAPRTAVAVLVGQQAEELWNPGEGVPKPGWYLAAVIISSLVVLAIIGEMAKRAVERVAPTQSSGDAEHS